MTSLPFSLKPLTTGDGDSSSKWSQRIVVGLAVLSVLLGGICIGYGVASLWRYKNQSLSPIICENGDAVSMVHVDVSGFVKEPGVYSLPLGSRVSDAVIAAGGLGSEADMQYVQQSLNMAHSVMDGQKVYVPSVAERQVAAVNTGSVAGAVSSTTVGTGVSINSATAKQLETLPGIGAKRAEDIIAGRPFGAVSELLDNKIVPSNVFAEIESLITL